VRLTLARPSALSRLLRSGLERRLTGKPAATWNVFIRMPALPRTLTTDHTAARLEKPPTESDQRFLGDLDGDGPMHDAQALAIPTRAPVVDMDDALRLVAHRGYSPRSVWPAFI
jgi:hypothetical protein